MCNDYKVVPSRALRRCSTCNAPRHRSTLKKRIQYIIYASIHEFALAVIGKHYLWLSYSIYVHDMLSEIIMDFIFSVRESCVIVSQTIILHCLNCI